MSATKQKGIGRMNQQEKKKRRDEKCQNRRNENWGDREKNFFFFFDINCCPDSFYLRPMLLCGRTRIGYRVILNDRN